jgi:branched-chain amino acid transport system permease protein
MISELISGLMTGGVYAIVGLGLSLVFGVMRLVNLAYGELIVFGAYAAALVAGAIGLDPFLSLVLVVPLMALIAYPLQRFLFTGLLRRGIEPPLVASFGVSLTISAILTQVFGGTTQSLNVSYATVGVNLLGTRVRLIDLIGLAIGVVLVIATHLFLSRSRWGSALTAASTDPATAGTMGINVNVVYALTFAASAAVAAVAGVLIGTAYSYAPDSGTNYMLIGFTVVVLGGAGNVMGTLWGGLALGVIQSLGGAFFGGQYRDFVIYAAFIIVLAAKPTIDALRSRASTRTPRVAEAVIKP